MSHRRRHLGDLLKIFTITVCAFLLNGCTEARWNMLEPEGPAAASIATLGWYMMIVGGIIYVAVLAYLLYALFRRRREDESDLLGGSDGTRIVVLGGVAMPVIVLGSVYAFTLFTMRALAEPRGEEVMEIEVIGHQWWWEVRYPEWEIVTANEMRIPAGEPVRLRLTTADVIHSFWAPDLTGKRDLNPGKTTSLTLEADEPGIYWVACAEFCGVQHANMQMVIVAEPVESLAEWLAQQQEPALLPEPGTAAFEGQQVFLGSACVYCHTIRGTNATGKLGPDLTHLASRLTIGAGLLPNTRGNLAGWIIDPHSGLKPGNEMPPMDLTGPELQVLLDYLETLE